MHNEELHDRYSSPSIIQLIKLWRMRWVGKVARGGGGVEKRNRSASGGLLGEGLKESVCLEDLDTEVRIIFRSILNRTGRCRLDLFSSG